MKKEIAVGLLFLISMVILGYYTIIMSGEFWKTTHRYEMVAYFPNVEGLSVKDRVKVNGVAVGSVEDIDLVGEEGTVRVVMQVTKKITMYGNYQIKIKNEGVLGSRYVGINPGKKYDDNRQYAEVESYDDLRGYPLADPLALLAELIDENRPNIYGAIASIRSIAQKIDEGRGTLGKLVNENRVHDSTENLIKEIRDAIEDTREQAPVTSFLRAALTAF
jgi:phospholipid/cholesterol/gamma-HCH transport system substrate-binding protein